MRHRGRYLIVSLSVAAVFGIHAEASAQQAAPSAPAAAQAKGQDEVVFDNQAQTDEMARQDAAQRRAKYQGDSPFPDAQMPPDRVREEEDEGDFRPLALTINPITLVLGRIGANIEFLPVPHHGIMLNPYYSSMSAESDWMRTSYESWGGELGYHFYTGNTGASGFFVGPSFVFTRTTRGSECLQAGCTVDPDIGFTTYGVAVDLGGQHVFDNGFTIGGGGGLMYLKSSATAEGSTVLKFEGVVPRMLFTIGYSI